MSSPARTPEDAGELREKLRAIIKAPMRSEISTADIAVGMWSSTALSEKIHDLEQLIAAEQTKLLEKLESELPEKVNAKKLFENGDIDWNRYEYESGHNATIDQVRTLISKHKEGLKQ